MSAALAARIHALAEQNRSMAGVCATSRSKSSANAARSIGSTGGIVAAIMTGMRLIAGVVAATVLVTGCATNTYKIPTGELQRISMQPPEMRGERVRVQQELGEADVGPPQPVTTETQI